MPELPEVETTVRGLHPYIVGKTIVSVWTDPKKPIKSGSAPGWIKTRKLLTGQKITDVQRRAKYVVVYLKNNTKVYIHQKMSGHLVYTHDGLCPGHPCHTPTCVHNNCRAYIRFDAVLNNGHHISLCDQRRFGRLMVVPDKNISQHPELNQLGPEPLDMSEMAFRELFVGKRGYIKPTLMNPSFIAGIGNIYADEILWSANLHPLSRVERLGQRDLDALFAYTHAILKKAVKLGGSSTDDYRMPTGAKGEFQMQHNAYQRTGQKCLRRDGGIIERLVIGQRSAHLCPKHQKLKN